MATRRQQEYLDMIAKREAAVRRKMQRLAKKGVRAEGTSVDPRRANVGNMNAREMRKYLGQLDSFMDRRRQFVPGVSGKPIDARQWNRYKFWENKGNQFSLEYRRKIENIQAPKFKGDVTLGEYREQKRGNLPSRLVPSVNDPFDVRGRISRGVPDERALEKLIQSEKKRSTKKHFENWFNYSTTAAEKMLNQLNQPELLKKIKNLSPEQFHAFWEFGGNDVALNYTIAKDAFEGEDDEPLWWQERSNANDFDELDQLADWASSINTDGKPQGKPKKPRKPKNPNAVDIYSSTKANPNGIKIYTSTKAGPIDIP